MGPALETRHAQNVVGRRLDGSVSTAEDNRATRRERAAWLAEVAIQIQDRFSRFRRLIHFAISDVIESFAIRRAFAIAGVFAR